MALLYADGNPTRSFRMDNKTETENLIRRRSFIFGALAGLATAPFSAVFAAAPVSALKPLDPKSPQAAALKYVVDVKTAVGAKPGQNCANCKLFKPDGGCQIFPGASVSKKGWCSAWVSAS